MSSAYRLLSVTYGLARELAWMMACMSCAHTRAQYSLQRHARDDSDDECQGAWDNARDDEACDERVPLGLYPANGFGDVMSWYWQDAWGCTVDGYHHGPWTDEIREDNTHDGGDCVYQSYRTHRRGRANGPSGAIEACEDLSWTVGTQVMGEAHGAWKSVSVSCVETGRQAHGLDHGISTQSTTRVAHQDNSESESIALFQWRDVRMWETC